MIAQSDHNFIKSNKFPLLGNRTFPDEYFLLVGQFVNMCEEIIPNRKELLESLKSLHSRARKYPRNKFELLIQKIIAPELQSFEPIIHAQLAEFPFYRIWSRNLRRTMRTYHLIMLEIELMNRINKEAFLKSHGKIALFPHFLRNINKESSCLKSSQIFSGKSGSGKSFMIHVSNIFLDFGIDAYLWMSSSLASIFKLLKSNKEHFAVIGIASIPELYNSMQKCMKIGVPMLGVPINSNSYGHWMQTNHENSVYLEEVEKLLAD